MKKWFGVWLGAAVCAGLCVLAAVFLRGWLCAAVIVLAVMAWTVFLVRFGMLRYSISDSEIVISGGLLFRYSRRIERSEILSQTRLYAGRQLICTVVRTAGSTDILFCSLSEN